MTGTAWQCIDCGSTDVFTEGVDVPAELAQLIEVEYKQVMWGVAHPGSKGVSLDLLPNAKQEAGIPLISPELKWLWGKKLRTKSPLGRWGIVASWVFVFAAVILLLALLLPPIKADASPIRAALLLAFAATCSAIAVVIFLLVLAPLRRRRIGRVVRASALERSPSSRIEPLSRGDAFTEKQVENRTEGTAEKGKDDWQILA
jgi:hypothetical protein